jgi:hypothetical protein
MTTVEALSAPIVAAFDALYKDLLEEAVQGPNATWDHYLERVQQTMQPLVRRVAETVVLASCRYQSAPDCPHCERRMHSKGTEGHQVLSHLGELKLPARRWRCPDCDHEARPALETAGLRHHCTPRLTETALRLTTCLPYRQAEIVLADFGLALSDNTLQRLNREVGGERTAARTAEAQAVAAWQQTVTPEWWAERLYQLVDGCNVRVRDTIGGWREVRLGVHFGTARTGRNAKGQPPPPERIAAIASVIKDPEDVRQADSFMRLVYAQAERCGQQRTAELVLLSDGADWIWPRALGQVPLGTPAVEILDFFHAAEQLSGALKVAFGPGSRAYQERWDRLRGWLVAGDIKAVEDDLAALQEQLSGEAAAEVRRVRQYVKKHRHRMSYLRLKWAGYHIGSGTVESWCKLLLRRLRGPGMRWSERGLEAMLALQTHYLVEDWQPSRRLKAA